ncbi:GNAT family N-acetyltransferase [Dysgonomonas sp. ZJ709]|uniref:GNAT family N-acetyltransferase n=1 Tax=Dysgonomonas sp. ZJ709 TaxID=2709797 RepID=UPI0013ED6D4F|nr:GNAT family N-acetyltransferase [Dysgonomonas sp. ZJ709]
MAEVNIELYKPIYKQDFIRLNTEWITTYFVLEESDLKTLENVEDIITNGGQIFLALLDGEVVGCCALIKHAHNDSYELAKMAVSPTVQGLGFGRRLGEYLINYAKERNIDHLFLEGNTKMEASIILYRKLGFKEVPITDSSYDRCNIMMVFSV